jgi:hypothetical protein
MKIEKEVLGYKTLEVTSSSIHSLTISGIDKQDKNPRRLMSTAEHNYKVISAASYGSSIEGFISCCGQPRRVFYTYQFKVDRDT